MVLYRQKDVKTPACTFLVFQKLWLFVIVLVEVSVHVRSFATFTPAPKLTSVEQILS